MYNEVIISRQVSPHPTALAFPATTTEFIIVPTYNSEGSALHEVQFRQFKQFTSGKYLGCIDTFCRVTPSIVSGTGSSSYKHLYSRM